MIYDNHTKGTTTKKKKKKTEKRKMQSNLNYGNKEMLHWNINRSRGIKKSTVNSKGELNSDYVTELITDW